MSKLSPQYWEACFAQAAKLLLWACMAKGLQPYDHK